MVQVVMDNKCGYISLFRGGTSAGEYEFYLTWVGGDNPFVLEYDGDPEGNEDIEEILACYREGFLGRPNWAELLADNIDIVKELYGDLYETPELRAEFLEWVRSEVLPLSEPNGYLAEWMAE
jgi:hypothetical protein